TRGWRWRECRMWRSNERWSAANSWTKTMGWPEPVSSYQSFTRSSAVAYGILFSGSALTLGHMQELYRNDRLAPMSEIGPGVQNATGIRDGIARAGYAFVEASDMRNALARFGTLADWPAFAESWNDLEVGTYIADGGRYRRRRFRG